MIINIYNKNNNKNMSPFSFLPSETLKSSHSACRRACPSSIKLTQWKKYKLAAEMHAEGKEHKNEGNAEEEEPPHCWCCSGKPCGPCLKALSPWSAYQFKIKEDLL